MKQDRAVNRPRGIFSKVRMPLIIWVVLIFTSLSCAVSINLFGFNMSGYGWFVPFSINAVIMLRKAKDMKFPLKIWLPWLILVGGYQLFATVDNSLQRSVMLVSPIVTGLAVSTFRANDNDLEYFYKLCRYMAIFLLLSILVRSGIFSSGILPYSTGLAPQVMTGSILCCIFAARNAYGSVRDLYFWASLAILPVIAVTRMGMIAAAVTLPMTFAPMRVEKRVLFLVLIGIAATSLFYTERIQKKMFFSGEGTIRDLKWDNPDIATHGRNIFWELLKKNIREKPLLGHGANASEEVLSAYSEGLTHPHNDWLRLAHDYGFIGVGIFGITVIMQIIDLLKKARDATVQKKILFYSGASTVIIFVLFMLTDNIILYAAFFGHLQFAMLGLAYGASDQHHVNAQMSHQSNKKKIRIRW